MSEALISAVVGLAYLVLMFFICLFLVVGAKMCLIRFNQNKMVKKQANTPVPTKKPRAKKPVRSIEINPEEVDRIYVKKSS